MATHLTNANLLTLKAAIAAETDRAFVTFRTAGATGVMAEFYNAFVVRKTLVSANLI